MCKKLPFSERQKQNNIYQENVKGKTSFCWEISKRIEAPQVYAVQDTKDF
jgi:hypothetical protein